MADPNKAVHENVKGEFFVDTTCIDCDTCRQLAPQTFSDAGDYSYVHHQPDSEAQQRAALHALLACPTGSIGTQNKMPLQNIFQDFPIPIDDNVYYCGFNSPKSYGGSSYFIRHPDGNWLIDSPKYLPHLTKIFQQWGGIHRIFLTHSDDVGDVHKYAEKFGAQRIIHREELWSQPQSEIIIDGVDPVAITDEFTVIPTPGHSRGHCVLLYKNRFLFSGDHMWWDRDHNRLANPRYYYWNKRVQAESNKNLLPYTFEWVLPGHGQRVHLPAELMKREIDNLILLAPTAE